MAYREFYKPIETTVTDYSPLAQGLSNLFSSVAADYNRRKAAAAQYRYAMDYSKFQNDNKFNEAYVKSVSRIAQENFRKSSTPSLELINMEEQGKRYAADQKAQYDLFKNLDDQINKRGVEDKYYDPNIDKKLLQVAAFGEDGDVDFRTRGERLTDASSVIGQNPKAFKRKLYTSDWVKLYGEKTSEQKNGGPTFDRSKLVSSPFLDPKTGSHSINDQHISDYLNSRSDVKNSLEHDVKDEISYEVDQIRKLIDQGDERVSKFKNMKDGEIMLHLIGNEKDNPINNKPFNQRVRDKARNELQDAANVTLKTDVSYKQPKSINNVNEDQRHEFAFYNNDVNGERLSAPGGTLMQKNGKPLQIDADGERSFDLRTGKTSKRTGQSTFNVTGYQIVPFLKDGRPMMLQGKDADSMIESIKNMPEGTLMTLEPNMKVVLRGFSVDRNSAINDVNTKKSSLETQLGNALEANNQEDVARIQSQLQSLENIKRNLGMEEVSDDEIISAMRKNNVTTNSVRYDELLTPSEADLKKVKAITTASDGSGGLNLQKQEAWSDDMRRVNQAFQDRLNEIRKKQPDVVKIIKSTGDDYNTWKPGKNYQVGDAIYYYDSINKRWAKR